MAYHLHDASAWNRSVNVARVEKKMEKR